MKKSFMKNRLGRGISLFTILTLLTTGVSFPAASETAKAAAPSGNISGDHRVAKAPKMDKLVELKENTVSDFEENALLSPALKIGQYANLLSNTEKALYKLVVGAVSNYAPYGTSEEAAFQKYAYTMEVSASVYNELASMRYSDFQLWYQHVSEAAIYDNIDKVQFVMCDVPRFKWFKSGEKYYAQTIAIAYYPYDYDSMNQKLKSARSRFLSSIPNGATPQETEAIIHEALIDNVRFNNEYVSLPNFHSCYTAYGALVEGSAVCDGYAQAMSYLLQAKGIDSLIVTGGVGSTKTIAGANGHAWNIVKLGSEWYEIDTTWDDTDTEDDSEVKRYAYFNVTTDYMEHLGASSHLRAAPYIGSLMDSPRATGTTYTYEYMKNNYPNVFSGTAATEENEENKEPEENETTTETPDTDNEIKAENDNTPSQAQEPENVAGAESVAVPRNSDGSEIVTGSGKAAYKYEVLDDGVTVTFKGIPNKKVKTVNIPEVVSDANGTKYTVTEIAKVSLKGRKKLGKLTVPKTVTTIKKNAFKGCKELSKITIYGDSLNSVESGAFSGISKKATFTIRTSDKAKYKKIVKKLKKAGAKNAKFRRKK